MGAIVGLLLVLIVGGALVVSWVGATGLLWALIVAGVLYACAFET